MSEADKFCFLIILFLLIFNIFILIILIDLKRLFSQILVFSHYTLRQTEYLKETHGNFRFFNF